jgi:hypothetical protein
MKVVEVTKDDVRMLAQVINMLHTGEFSLNGKDVCAGADAIRWLQRTAVAVSESYSAASTAPAPAPAASAPFTIKAHQPGKKK